MNIKKKKNNKFKLKKKKIVLKKPKKFLVKKGRKLIVKKNKKNKPKKKFIKKVLVKVKKNRIIKKKRKKVSVVSKVEPILKKKKILKGGIIKIKKTVKIKKNKAPNQNPSFLSRSFFKAKIKVIGIGGGGSSIVSEISKSLDKATFVIADTDTRVFHKQRGVKYFLFGQEQTHGLGTGLNPELARDAAEQEKEKIANLFQDQNF